MSTWSRFKYFLKNLFFVPTNIWLVFSLHYTFKFLLPLFSLSLSLSLSLIPTRISKLNGKKTSVACVCVCVCVKERENERVSVSRSSYCVREKDNETRWECVCVKERERVKNVNFSNSSWPVTVFGDVQKSIPSFEKTFEFWNYFLFQKIFLSNGVKLQCHNSIMYA